MEHEEQFTVERPVAVMSEGKVLGRHKVWYIHLGGHPVGPAFNTKAEATFYLHHHYLYN